MVRRRSQASKDAAWLTTFVESDWPGRCSLERWQSWHIAQLQESPTDPGRFAAASRAARRSLSHENCELHPMPDAWPTGWQRASEKVRFMLTDRDGSQSEEEVENDSPRDIELREAFEKWARSLGR
jgi:hypothetical protein